MTKVFGLSDVDCPVCAGKMQEAIARIDGVISARIDFLVLKLNTCMIVVALFIATQELQGCIDKSFL